MTAMLRQIELSGFLPVTKLTTEKPDLIWVDIDQLVIDGSYQRDLELRGRRNIQEIATHFSWDRFTPLLVSPIASGKLAIIDGQHRAHAAALCGFDQVPATVVEMTHKEQARAFAWVNGQVTAITPLQVFKAALVAGEEWAIGCHQVVADAGCQMMTANYSAAAKKPGQVFCIGLIKSHVVSGRRVIVRCGLKSIRKSNCGVHTDYYGSVVLKAWFAAIERKRVRSVPVLVEFLNGHPLGEVLHNVDRLRETPGYFNKSRGGLFQLSLQALLAQFLKKQRDAAS